MLSHSENPVKINTSPSADGQSVTFEVTIEQDDIVAMINKLWNQYFDVMKIQDWQVPLVDKFYRSSLCGRRSPRKLRKLRKLMKKHQNIDLVAQRVLG